ncbi:MAG: ABC transporter permease, partial [Clostridia bacterium]
MNALKKLYNKDVHISRLIGIMVIWLVFMAVTKFSKFYTVVSFQTMGAQFPEFGLMALGVMLCMISGGIDLSVVGIANFTGISMGLLLKVLVDADGVLLPIGIPVVFVLGLLLGAAAGAFNGFLV